MTERTSHLAGLWIGAAISNTSQSNKAGFTTVKRVRLTVKDQGRRQCCHNRHKDFPIGLHVMYLYFPDTPRVSLLFAMEQQPPFGQSLLIIEDSRSHSDTPHSVRLLWTSDQPVAEPCTSQHTTLTTDKNSCPRRVSNSQSQQMSGRRLTPSTARPLESNISF